MSLRLTILGCHSATPRSLTYTSSQFLEMNNECCLIDCGEGTQRQLRKYKIKFSRIKYVFISHLHGDHFFGLIGLISTFSLLGRNSELHIFGPKGLKEIILLQLKLSKSWMDFPLHFHELISKESELILENDRIKVYTIPLKHRIYTNGFLFMEQPQPRKLNMPEISKYKEIDICDYQNLKNGKDYVLNDGKIIPNEVLTLDPPKPLSYGYCSDTEYYEEIIPLIEHIDLLYHEATFLEEHRSLAEKTKHSTAYQAAKIAQQAQVKRLLLGHYSSRYPSLELFLEEAVKIFKNTELAEAGHQIELSN
ncbi:ribonuclease Z [Lutimonas zeaxanthinifaciens]|uniref:ribonuclease Z n=1 Tax=Lutimonas zeaxanthinifaciens TaxID=3060215 RepID=UPI00265CA1F4|nr:ribonuclease Z [Lutimonas sp. YSD2104]WKK64925.1 ribonuclease Z [Lutimonas sp. YSD2104]